MNPGTEQILADHYQKTFELTLNVWEQRNRTFLILLAVVGAASLLTFNVSQAQPLLADLIAKMVGVEDATRRAELRTSFPYGLIQSILLMVVLYLTLILYHRTTFILRSYEYLAAIEKELRDALALPSQMVSFTREGSYYVQHKPALSKAIGATYVLMLGILLVAFLAARVHTDFTSSQIAFGVVDLLLAIPTLLFFRAYALASISSKLVKRLLLAKA